MKAMITQFTNNTDSIPQKYFIENYITGNHELTILNAVYEEGQPIVHANYTGDDEQVWLFFILDGNEEFTIVNYYADFCVGALDVEENASAKLMSTESAGSTF